MRPNSFDVIRIPTDGPGDVSGLMALIDSGALEPSSILAVLGKTEGNGGVNDFTREYAVAALCNALSPHLKLAPREVEARIAFVMSGGTEGVLSPHITVFARSGRPEGVGENPSEKRLSVGIAHTRDFLPEEIGRDAQIEETAKAVEAAMRDASIEAVSDVHFVQIKCPLLTSERVKDAAARGRTTVTASGYASMGYSRGASAIGVAKALGRDRRRGRRKAGAEGLDALFVRRLLLGRHRAHAQCRHSDRQFALLVEPVQDRPRGDAGCDRPSSGDAGARERGIERARRAIARAGSSTFSPRPKPLPTAPSAASATRCSRIRTSTPRGTPARRSAD